MLATQSASAHTHNQTELGDLREIMLAARTGVGETRLLAAAMRTLGAWLTEQSHLLSQAADDHRTLNVHELTGPERLPPGTLTPRERQVAALIARGYSNREIAAEMVIALGTTERHVANILAKLGMRSRSQVAAWVVERHLV
jgi:DNA-binding NarL/FixJ family response regulator